MQRPFIPWRGKLAAKLVLSRLPVGRRTWKRMGLFEHGAMQNPEYAWRVFASHFERACQPEWNERGFVALELGPGDSLCTALIARAHGANQVYLVDSGNCADRRPLVYRRMYEYLCRMGLPVASLAGVEELGEILRRCHAEYRTEGLASLRSLPAQSVDFVFSQAVLEHVRKAEFLATQVELRRILRPGGRCSHRIDFQDHFNGGRNNLRFSERVWESRPFVRAGFYTNRIPFSRMLELFQQAGFKVEIALAQQGDPGLSRGHLSLDCSSISEEDLHVAACDVLLA